MVMQKGLVNRKNKCNCLDISTIQKINRLLNSTMRIRIKLVLMKKKLTLNRKCFKPRVLREDMISVNSHIIATSKINRQLRSLSLIIRNSWTSSGENWLLALRKKLKKLNRFPWSALRVNKSWPNSDSRLKLIRRKIFQN